MVEIRNYDVKTGPKNGPRQLDPDSNGVKPKKPEPKPVPMPQPDFIDPKDRDPGFAVPDYGMSIPDALEARRKPLV
jgi:hypothetical protein